MSGTGTRVDRIYTDTASQTRESERQSQRLQSSAGPFRRAVVVEIFNDPIKQINSDLIQKLKDDVKDVDAIDRLPRGAILARVLSGGSDHIDSRPHIFLPLFGPYFMPPVKVGEHIFVMYDDPNATVNIGFWVCRVPELSDVDDINYTHGDRRYSNITEIDTIDKLELGQSNLNILPDFPNGHIAGDAPTLGSSPDEYNRILNSSRAATEFACEAVPRFAPNPGDFTVQGSNNTLLCLTTNSILSGSASVGTGTVVISCGRGQTATTAATTVINTRDNEEVDKTPIIRGNDNNMNEGSIDCINDLTTFVMSMKTNIDQLFEIDIQNGGEASQDEQPAAALKSSRVRIIARDDIKLQAGSNETGAAIVIKASGDIVLIPGPNGVIYLGGETATTALLGNNGANAAGSVIGQPIISTMAGVVGHAQPHGRFGSKVLTT